MPDFFQKILQKLTARPRQLFFIDSMGAMLTALMLGLVLPKLDAFFFMPEKILGILAGIALGFALYSMCCHLFLKKSPRPFLLAILLANAAYCVLSFILLLNHYGELSTWDLLYFAGEILIVLVLVGLEFSVWKALGRP